MSLSILLPLTWLARDETVLCWFPWHTHLGEPARAVATTHRIMVWGEHRLGLDPYWCSLYDFSEIAPARSFAIHDGDWYLDLGHMVIRNQRPYSHWEEV